jgi:hypothetical protein
MGFLLDLEKSASLHASLLTKAESRRVAVAHLANENIASERMGFASLDQIRCAEFLGKHSCHNKSASLQAAPAFAE